MKPGSWEHAAFLWEIREQVRRDLTAALDAGGLGLWYELLDRRYEDPRPRPWTEPSTQDLYPEQRAEKALAFLQQIDTSGVPLGRGSARSSTGYRPSDRRLVKAAAKFLTGASR